MNPSISPHSDIHDQPGAAAVPSVTVSAPSSSSSSSVLSRGLHHLPAAVLHHDLLPFLDALSLLQLIRVSRAMSVIRTLHHIWTPFVSIATKDGSSLPFAGRTTDGRPLVWVQRGVDAPAAVMASDGIPSLTELESSHVVATTRVPVTPPYTNDWQLASPSSSSSATGGSGSGRAAYDQFRVYQSWDASSRSNVRFYHHPLIHATTIADHKLAEDSKMNGTYNTATYTNPTHHLMKIVFMGPLIGGAVGKTNLVRRFIDDPFQEHYVRSFGAEFRIRHVWHDDTVIKVQAWDVTIGAERFRATDPRHAYHGGAHGIFFVFDLCNRESWIAVQQEIAASRTRISSKGCPIFLLGNKSDLINDDHTMMKDRASMLTQPFECDEKPVPLHEIHAYATREQIAYISTSARTGDGVTLAMRLMVAAIWSHRRIHSPSEVHHGSSGQKSSSSSSRRCVVQ